MIDHETVPADGRGQALLVAIAELRDAVGALIDEQTELVLRRGDGPAARVAPVRSEPPAGPPPAPPPALARVDAGPSPRQPSDATRTGDPRQRLDALARLLDRRVKPPAGTAQEPPSRDDGR